MKVIREVGFIVLVAAVSGILIANAGEVDMAKGNTAKIIFLHHSTGNNVWQGGVKEAVDDHNKKNGTDYRITERAFPKESPYGWHNYPFDYWNIWVKNAGAKPYMEEPTLEMLTKEYDVIVFKHCFPVAGVKPDTGKPYIASDTKTIGNYKLQYEALKKKLREFPKTKFIVWTGAMLGRADTGEASAKRAKDFFKWVKEVWDETGDNIYLWDFEELETGGGLYLTDEYQAAPDDSHPNEKFCRMAAPLFAGRMIDVIEGRGDTGSLTGQ